MARNKHAHIAIDDWQVNRYVNSQGYLPIEIKKKKN